MNISPVKKNEIPEILDFFKKIYPDRPIYHTKEFFKWQFMNSPYNTTNDYNLWICRSNDSICSFLGVIPTQIRCDGKIYPGYSYQYWYAIKPSASNLNLLLRNYGKCDFKLFIGAGKNTEKILDALKIPKLKPLPRWICCLNFDQVINIFQINDSYDKSLLHKNYLFIKNLINSNDIEVVDRFDDEEEFILEKNHRNINTYQRRSGKYLNWRYLDIPFHDYRAIRGSGNSYAVYRVENIKGFDVNFIRLLELCGNNVWLKKAMSYIVNEGKVQNSIGIDFFCASKEFGKYLCNIGLMDVEEMKDKQIPYLFRPIHYTEGFCIFIQSNVTGKRANFGNWYITKGDSDIDQIRF